MLEGKLVLVGDDGLPLKHVNANSQANVMGTFPSLFKSFGSPNMSLEVDIAGDKSNGTRPRSYDDRLNGDLSKNVVNFLTLIASAVNGVDVAVSKDSVQQVMERFENSVYWFFMGKRVMYHVVENYVKKV